MWVGWPGTYVDPGVQSSLVEQLKEHRLVPIFLVSFFFFTFFFMFVHREAFFHNERDENYGR